MDTLTACRALLRGATLFAATAMAMAAPHHGPAAGQSPCLDQSRSDQTLTAKQRDHWRKQCHLADAEKIEEEYTNDGAGPKEKWELVDEAMALSRLVTPNDDTHALNWMTPQGGATADEWQPQPSGGPGSTAFHNNPLYRTQLAPLPLRPGSASLEGEIPAVPEPANLIMLLGGLALLARVAARRRRAP